MGLTEGPDTPPSDPPPTPAPRSSDSAAGAEPAPVLEPADAEVGPVASGPKDAVPLDAAPTEIAPTEAGPTEAGPTDAAPTEAAPTEAAPTEAGPTEAGPTDAAPTEAAPTEAAPTEAGPTEVAVEAPSPPASPLLARLPPPLRRVASTVATTFDRMTADGALLVRRIAWPVAFALAIAAFLWPVFHRGEIDALLSNKLPTPRRLRALEWSGGAVAITAGVYVIATALRRVVTGRFAVGDTVDRMNGWFSGVIVLPFLLPLYFQPLEKSAPFLVVVVAVLAGVFVGRSAYHLEPPRLFERIGRARFVGAALAGASLAGLWGAYATWFTRLAVTNHRALNTQTADLGYYDNIFYQSLHGTFLGCSFMKGGVHYTGHFDPILVLLSPVYALHPQAELLLGLQSVWLGSSVVPLYLLARHYGHGRILSVTLGAVFVAYPALHGVNMYEFHSLALVVPLLLWALFFLESHRMKSLAAMVGLLFLVREDVPLLLAFVGFYAMLSGDPKKVRAGAAIAAAAALYFVAVKTFIMKAPDPFNTGKDTISFGYYYKDLLPAGAETTSQLVVTLLTNPGLVMKAVFTEPKLLFFLQLLVPLAVLPLFARRRRIMLLYGALFLFLASKEPVFTVHFQYTAVFFPVAFALVPAVLSTIREGDLSTRVGYSGAALCRGLAAFMLASTLVLSWKFGGALESETFRGGFRRVVREPSAAQQEAYAWVKEAQKLVREEDSVAVTGSLGPHFSNRMVAKFWRDRRHVQYVAVNEKELDANMMKTHKQEIASGQLVELSRHKTYALFRTQYDPKPPR